MAHHDLTEATISLLLRLYDAGVEVAYADGGNDLTLEARDVPPAELLAEVQARKADVLALLRNQRIGEVDADSESDVPRRHVVPPSCGPTAACARLGPCERFRLGQACDVELEAKAERSRYDMRVTRSDEADDWPAA